MWTISILFTFTFYIIFIIIILYTTASAALYNEYYALHYSSHYNVKLGKFQISHE